MQSIVNNRYALFRDRPVAGGMADVYKAADLRNDGRKVALKMFVTAKKMITIPSYLKRTAEKLTLEGA